jgi:iron complex outermembrane receptor protein
MKKSWCVSIISLIFILCTSLYSQQEESKLEEMSLDDLLNMSITTVSKRTQSISESPAIVTVITAEQIKNLGVSNVSELMSFVPGFTVMETYWKKNIVTARGVMMTLYNDKILMLVDGIPFYDADAMEHFLDAIPIGAIKHLEIIRGPASSLYGTNAYSAVINVITRSGDTPSYEGYAKIGSFAERNIGITFGNKAEDFNYFLSASSNENDGFDKKTMDETGLLGTLNYQNSIQNLFGKIDYKNINFSLGYFNQVYGKFGPVPVFKYGNRLHKDQGRTYHKKYFATFMFDHSFSDNLDMKIFGRYDFSDKQAEVGEFGTIFKTLVKPQDSAKISAPDYIQFGGNIIQGEVQFNYYMEKFSFVGGFAAERREVTHLSDLLIDFNGDNIYVSSTKKLPISIFDYGFYLQADGKIFEELGLVIGLRTNYLNISKKFYFTPRVGLVYTPLKGTSIKMLYGEAFRGAGPQEQYYAVPKTVYGTDAVNRGLEPEKIKTYEVAIDQELFTRYKLRVNYFITDVIGIINRRNMTAQEMALIGPFATGAKLYDNLGDQSVKGIELDFTAYPVDNLNLFGNFSYKKGKDKTTNTDLLYLEDITYNLGLTWDFYNFTFTPTIQFIGDRKGKLVSKKNPNLWTVLDRSDSLNFTLNSYTLMNLNIQYKVTDRLNINAAIKNIFDVEYFYPEYVRRNIPYIPGGPQRSFNLGVGYRFN